MSSSFDHESGSTLSIDGAEIYFEVVGDNDAPALLCLHGGVGTMADFNGLLPHLQDFRVIGLDSRGHGRSTGGNVPMTYQQLERDTRAVLEHLEVEDVAIIGFSDGGTVACRLASRSGLNVRKLITIGATWHNDHSQALKKILSTVNGDNWRAKFPETADDYERWNPEPDFSKFVSNVVDMWMDNTETGHPGDDVRKIDCPTLVVRGDDDHLVSFQWCVELTDHIEESHFLNIPFAGHVAFADQPEVFLASARHFLSL